MKKNVHEVRKRMELRYQRDVVDRTVLVDAVLDSEEGVFGIGRDVKNPQVFHLLGGDDGHWWINASYHEHWAPMIKDMVNESI